MTKILTAILLMSHPSPITARRVKHRKSLSASPRKTSHGGATGCATPASFRIPRRRQLAARRAKHSRSTLLPTALFQQSKCSSVACPHLTLALCAPCVLLQRLEAAGFYNRGDLENIGPVDLARGAQNTQIDRPHFR